MTDYAHQVAALRPALVASAQRMVRNEAWAEDAVSETLVAALQKPDAYSGAAQLRTWLTAILKHKVLDQIRLHSRELPVADFDNDAGRGPECRSGAGPAIEVAVDWEDPARRLGRMQFISQLDACLRALPPRQARVFCLHDAMEKETAEICDELGITANNLAVTLHRARHRLREMLQAAWAPGPGRLRVLEPQA